MATTTSTTTTLNDRAWDSEGLIRRRVRSLSIQRTLSTKLTSSGHGVGRVRSNSDRFIPACTRSSSLKLNSGLVGSPGYNPRSRSVSLPTQSSAANQSAIETRLASALGFPSDSRVFVYDDDRDSDTTASSIVEEHPSSSPKLRPSPQSCFPKNLSPYKVLDAPGLRDDFYTSLISWSPKGEMAVALGKHVYVWTPDKGAVPLVSSQSLVVSSLSYSDDGEILAIGLSDGQVYLCGRAEKTPRVVLRHSGEVGTMAWRPLKSQPDPQATSVRHHLLVGEGGGQINLYQLRWSRTTKECSFLGRQKILCHVEQVCGLCWSPDGAYFATGANDNKACLFHMRHKAELRFEWPHNAAVKALSFCPWQKDTLATGSGTKDKHLRVFNCRDGRLLKMFDCGAQITSIVWSLKFKELLVSFGFGSVTNTTRLRVYTYPEMKLVYQVPSTYIEQRSTFAVQTVNRDACGHVVGDESVVVAGSDETFSFYRIWSPEQFLQGRGGRVLRWEGMLGSDILEFVEGIEKGADGHIR